MRITVGGHDYTLRTWLKMEGRAVIYLLRCLGPCLLGIAVGARLVCFIGVWPAVAFTCLCLAVVVAKCLPWYRCKSWTRRAIALLTVGALFIALVYLPFFRWGTGRWFADTAILLGASAVALVASSLLSTAILDPDPFVERMNQLCPECGLVMRVTHDRFGFDGYDDRVYAPGKIVRTAGPFRRFVTHRCDECGSSVEEIR